MHFIPADVKDSAEDVTAVTVAAVVKNVFWMAAVQVPSVTCRSYFSPHYVVLTVIRFKCFKVAL